MLVNHLWQSTVFAAAAGLFTLVFRRNRAQVRFLLWFCASLKFLVPFTLLMSLGNYWESRSDFENPNAICGFGGDEPN